MEMVKAKYDRDMMRSLSIEGSILVICEPGTFEMMRDGMKYPANTIIERKGDTEIIVRKAREHVSTVNALMSYYGVSSSNFMDIVDAMYGEFQTVIIFRDRLDIINLRKEDLKGENALSKWYHDKRGYFAGKKFGL